MMINSSSKPIQASKTHNLTIFLLILISKNNLTSITLNIPILINISTTNSLISTSMIKISTSMIKISSSIDLISSKSSSVMKKTHLKKTEIGMLRVTIKSNLANQDEKLAQINQNYANQFTNNNQTSFQQIDSHHNIFLSNQQQYNSKQSNTEQDVEEREDLQEYDKLSFADKINNKRWQVRRKLYQELNAAFEQQDSYLLNQYVKDFEQNPDVFLPWLKNIVNDNNLIAFNEGLNALHSFISHYRITKHTLEYFINDLINRQVKNNQQEIVFQIFEKSINYDENDIILGNIVKQFGSKNPKNTCTSLQILIRIFGNDKFLSQLNSQKTRSLFTQLLGLMNHTNKDIRALVQNVFVYLFAVVEDSFTEISQSELLNNLRDFQIKELKDIYKKAKKMNLPQSFRIMTENDFQSNKQKQLEKMEEQNHFDLNNIFPEKLNEYTYINDQNQKVKILQELNDNLELFITKNYQIDLRKDYSLVFNILTSSMNESNYLIVQESLKCFDYLISIFQSNIPIVKFKYLLILIFDKFKQTKYNSTKNLQLYVLIEHLVKSVLTNIDFLLDVMINQIETSRNISTRLCLLEFIQDYFLTNIKKYQMNFEKNKQRNQCDQRPSIKYKKQQFDKHRVVQQLEQKLNQQLNKKNNVKIRRNIQQVLNKIQKVVKLGLDNQEVESNQMIDEFREHLKTLETLFQNQKQIGQMFNQKVITKLNKIEENIQQYEKEQLNIDQVEVFKMIQKTVKKINKRKIGNYYLDLSLIIIQKLKTVEPKSIYLNIKLIVIYENNQNNLEYLYKRSNTVDFLEQLDIAIQKYMGYYKREKQEIYSVIINNIYSFLSEKEKSESKQNVVQLVIQLISKYDLQNYMNQESFQQSEVVVAQKNYNEVLDRMVNNEQFQQIQQELSELAAKNQKVDLDIKQLLIRLTRSINPSTYEQILVIFQIIYGNSEALDQEIEELNLVIFQNLLTLNLSILNRVLLSNFLKQTVFKDRNSIEVYGKMFRMVRKSTSNGKMINLLNNLWKEINVNEFKSVKYIVESVIFMVQQQELHQQGHELLMQMFSRYDVYQLSQVIENQLQSQLKDYSVYAQWYDKNIAAINNNNITNNNLINNNVTNNNASNNNVSNNNVSNNNDFYKNLDDLRLSNIRQQHSHSKITEHDTLFEEHQQYEQIQKKASEQTDTKQEEVIEEEDDSELQHTLKKDYSQYSSKDDMRELNQKSSLQEINQKKNAEFDKNIHQQLELLQKQNNVNNDENMNNYMNQQNILSSRKHSSPNQFIQDQLQSGDKQQQNIKISNYQTNVLNKEDQLSSGDKQKDKKSSSLSKVREDSQLSRMREEHQLSRVRSARIPLIQQKEQSQLYKVELELEQQQNQVTKQLLERVNKQYLQEVEQKYEISNQLEQEKIKNQQLQNQLNKYQQMYQELQQKYDQLIMQVQSSHLHQKFKNSEEIIEKKTQEQFTEKMTQQQFMEKQSESKVDSQYKRSYADSSQRKNSRKSSQEKQQQPKLAKNKSNFIVELQQLIMQNDEDTNGIIDSIYQQYQQLRESKEKEQYIWDIKEAILDDTFLNYLQKQSILTNRNVFELVIKLCISDNTQQEMQQGNSIITYNLQTMIDSLLGNFREQPETLLIVLVQIIDCELPTDLSIKLSKQQVLMSKLVLKCIQKQTSQIAKLYNHTRLLELLQNINKFFKSHPPEELDEGLPSINELEYIFRCIKRLSDLVFESNPQQAKQFSEAIQKTGQPQNVFLNYLNEFLERYYHI